ncbi:MAG: hypothetical protein AAGA75_21525 [Cyanobacteria bacterium P01_E01_bin.6]
MSRTKGRVTPGYQKRLVDLVKQCQQRGDKTISLNQMSRELGNQSLASRFSLWSHTELKSPVVDDNFELLSKVDPQGRTSEQLKEWVENGDEFRDKEQEPDTETTGDVNIRSSQPLDVVRLFLNLISDNRPVHQMVEKVLVRHGHLLNDEGIDFFITYTNAAREQRKILIKRYLKNEPVSADTMIATYPCIATGINQLNELPIEIDGHDLQWLDFSRSSTQHIDSKVLC